MNNKPTPEQIKEAMIDMCKDLIEFHEGELTRLRMTLALLDGTAEELVDVKKDQDVPFVPLEQPIVTQLEGLNGNVYKVSPTDSGYGDILSQAKETIKNGEGHTVKGLVVEKLPTETIKMSGTNLDFFKVAQKLRGKRSQREIANAIGCSDVLVGYIETGRGGVSMNMVRKIAEYYKFHITEFVVPEKLKGSTLKKRESRATKGEG